MYTVRTQPEFERRLASIRDHPTRVRQLRRLERFQLGQWGAGRGSP
jgi:putative component of toxin-antitoxin plasmid stabilization module